MVNSCSRLGELAFQENKNSKGFKLLRTGCEMGENDSCSDLGEFYLDLKIYKKCEDYTEKACSKNIAHACFILSGCLHYQGKEKEALRIVKQNCENNYHKASCELLSSF